MRPLSRNQIGVGGGGGAPTDAQYVTLAGDPTLTNEAVLSTAVIMRGTHAARPAAGTAGRLYVCTDHFKIYRDNAVTWDDSAAWAHSALAGIGADDHHAQAHAISSANHTGTLDTAFITDDAVTDAKLANRTALSVIGRAANSVGDPADIAAANDGEVLRRSGASVGFGTLGTLGIAASAVTFPKLLDATAASVLIGRGSAGGAGNFQEVTLGAGMLMTGTVLSSTGGGGAPTTAPYVTLAADGGLSAEAVLGTSVIMKGNHASRPAAATAGLLYVCTTHGLIYRDTGAAWENVATGTGFATTADIADIAAAENAGSALTNAAGDHVHAHGSGYLPDAHHNQAHGAADHTDITRSITLSVEMMNVVGPAAIATFGADPNEIRGAGLDSGTTERIRFYLRVPDDWATGMSATLTWLAVAPGAGAETVRWSIDYAYFDDAGSAVAAGTNVTWTGVSRIRAANDTQVEAAQTIATGAGAGKVLRVTVKRIGADAGDTLTLDAALLSVRFDYTANQ